MIDITTIAIVLALTIAFCIPFIHSHRKKKKHERLLLKEFYDKAFELQLNVSTYDLWRRTYVIGIDTHQSKLLYMKLHPGTQVVSVDLKDIKRISISKEEREVGSGKEMQRVTEKLALSFSSSNTQDFRLEFYDSEENIELMGEPVLIKKWHDLVKEHIGEKAGSQLVN